MWIFTEVGFFSVVESREAGKLMVRSRNPKDLDLLRRIYLPELSETVMTPNRDYPARGFATKEQVAIAVGRIAASIDYTNFKDHVHDLDPERVPHYSKVWGVMLGSEPDKDRHYSYQSNLNFTEADSSGSAEASAQVFLGKASESVSERNAIAIGAGEDEEDLKSEAEIKAFLADWYNMTPEEWDAEMQANPELLSDIAASSPKLLGPGEEASYEYTYNPDDDPDCVDEVGTYMRGD